MDKKLNPSTRINGQKILRNNANVSAGDSCLTAVTSN